MDVTEEKEIFVTIICRSDKQTKTEINNVRGKNTKRQQRNYNRVLEKKIIDMKAITNRKNQNKKNQEERNVSSKML